MTIRGHIHKGVAVPVTPLGLPDGTPVRIEVERNDSPFWQHKTVETLAAEQGVVRIRDIDELAGDWPEEDSIDEFLGFLREVRR